MFCLFVNIGVPLTLFCFPLGSGHGPWEEEGVELASLPGGGEDDRCATETLQGGQ